MIDEKFDEIEALYDKYFPYDANDPKYKIPSEVLKESSERLSKVIKMNEKRRRENELSGRDDTLVGRVA